MTTPLVTSIPLTEPVSTDTRRFDYDHIPKLGPYKKGDVRGSLLPKEGGRPGLTYAQIPLRFVRYAEGANWYPMLETCRYTIIGPKGSLDMELMAQGRIIPGLSSCSTRCVCLAPLALICEETGLDPNTGFAPTLENAPDAQDPSPAPDLGFEVGSIPIPAEPEDPQSEEGQPEPEPAPSGGKGKGHNRRT